MKTRLLRTNSENNDFINLVKMLDAYLKVTDGNEHEFYNQFNKIDALKFVVVIYVDEKAVGCGAIKQFDDDTMEVKRMFVLEEYRNQGLAKKIIQELEIWAKDLNKKKCVLETGKRQKEAVNLYFKCGYEVIDNYGQYKNMENSICFQKTL